MKKVKVGDVYHVYCDWATGGLMEGIIQITKRPYGRIHYKVLKSIHQFKHNEELVGDMHDFFGGTIWTSTKLSKKEVAMHPEYFL